MGSVCAVREVGLHVVAMGGMWTTYGLCVCYEGGADCMW